MPHLWRLPYLLAHQDGDSDGGQATRMRGKSMTTPAMVTAMTEKQLAKNIVSEARRWGWRAHYAWTSIHSPKGWLDLVLCKPPVILFCELRCERGKLTQEQSEWIACLQAWGLDARVWRPGDLEEE
jgi:hypothetical protein